MHDFNPYDRTTGHPNRLEAEHRIHDPFDCSLALFHNIVQIFEGYRSFIRKPRCGNVASIQAELDRVCRKAALGAWFRSNGSKRPANTSSTFCGRPTSQSSCGMGSEGAQLSTLSG